jgi:hypothetical protein
MQYASILQQKRRDLALSIPQLEAVFYVGKHGKLGGADV